MKTFRLFLMLCLLLLPLAVRAQWSPLQEQEDNNAPERAQLLPNHTRLSGRLGSLPNEIHDTQDWYKIELEEDGKVEFAWHMPAWLSQHLIRLYDDENYQGKRERAQIFIVTQENPRDSTVVLTAEGLGKGTYYLQLFHDGEQGYYSLDYTFTPTSFANDPEPNDKAEDAVLLQNGQTLTGRFCFKYQRYTDNHDWYKIELPDDGKVEFTWHLPDWKAFNKIRLFEDLNSTTNISRESIELKPTETARDTTVVFTVDGLGKGTYHLHLEQYGPANGYHLGYTFTPASEIKDPEPNDEPSQASVLQSGQQVTGRLGYRYLGKTDKTDWYKIELADDGKVDLAWHIPDWQGYSAIELFDYEDIAGKRPRLRQHLQAAEAIRDTTLFLSAEGLAKGTYYLRLTQEKHGGVYKLDYTYTPSSLPSDPEPNDEKADATPLLSGQPITGRIGYEYQNRADRTDLYKIEPTDDGKAEFVWHIPAWKASCTIALYDEQSLPGGSPRASISLNHLETSRDTTLVLRVDKLAKATYYLKLYLQSSHGDYKLAYTHTAPPSANDPEPNDEPAQAAPLSNGQQVSGRLGYIRQQQIDKDDWYKIEVTEEGKAEFVCRLPAWNGTTILRLYESEQTTSYAPRFSKTLSAEQTSRDTTLVFTVDGLGKGTYFFYISQQKNAGEYSLAYKHTPNPFSINNAAHNSYDTRAQLNYGTTYSSALGYTYQKKVATTEEWYEVDTDNLSMLSLQIRRNAAVNLSCTLYRVDGTSSDGKPQLTRLETNNLESTVSTLNYAITNSDRGKTFVLKVNHRSGIGEYHLTHGDPRISKASPIRISYNGRSSLRKGVAERYAVTLINQAHQPTEPFMLTVSHTNDISLLGFNLPYKSGVQHLNINEVRTEDDDCATFVVPQLQPWEKYTFEIIAEGTGDISFTAPLADGGAKANTPTTMLSVAATTFMGEVVSDIAENKMTEVFTQWATDLYNFNDTESRVYCRATGTAINALREKQESEGVVAHPMRSFVETVATRFQDSLPNGKNITSTDEIVELSHYITSKFCNQLHGWFYEESGFIDNSPLRIVDAKPIATAIIASWDPNEMVGPQGYGKDNFIGLTRTIDYRILFENKAEAGAPAYRVRIFDELDPEVFNVESVQFGTTSHDDPQYQWKMSREGNRLIWDIEGIELPPNVKAPEGEGFVSFSVHLKPNLPDGQVIANKATIIFDKNTPIETNVYRNTLDLTAPIMQRIDAIYDRTEQRIDLQFEAQETGSGIAGYLLYVAHDGGDFELFGQCQGSKVYFPAETQHSSDYRFYALAIDNVGNTEDSSEVSAAIHTTTISSVKPHSGSEVIGIYNLDGRLQKTLQPGVHILRMRNGTTQKVIVQ